MKGSGQRLLLTAAFLFTALSFPRAQEVPVEVLVPDDGPVTVMYHPGDEATARSVASLATRLHLQVRQDLHLRVSVPVTIYLLRDRLYGREGRQGLPAPWIAGTADANRSFIVLRLYAGRSSMDYAGTVAHELTHVILDADYPRHREWPRWFREGLAMRQSGTEGFSHGKALFLSGFSGGLIPLYRLAARFPDSESGARLAYAQSYSVIAFLHSSYGRASFDRFLENLRRHEFEEAFLRSYGFGLAEMEESWRSFVSRRYNWIPVITGASTFWFLCVAVFFLSLAARRKRTLAIRARWEEEDGGRDTL